MEKTSTAEREVCARSVPGRYVSKIKNNYLPERIEGGKKTSAEKRWVSTLTRFR